MRLTDGGLVLGLALLIAVVAQRWAGLDTPDSSFYASLSLFGDQVTDRAPITSYFWTRLGFIGPVQVLTTVLGTWLGFAAWRFLLILIIVSSSYFLLKRFTGRVTSIWLTALIATSTVPLSYLGNSYLTGAVLAGTAALINLAVNPSRGAAILSGLTLGWLVMVNPTGVLLAGTIWLSITIHQKHKAPRALIFTLVAAAATTLLTFSGFLVWGRIIFPKMDWFTAYLDAQGINLSNFSSGENIFLKDISLVVIVLITLITLALWLFKRGSGATQLGFLIATTSAAFMLVFNPLMGGIALEAPLYQAMLWPPALIALALSTSAYISISGNATQLVVAVIAVIAVITAGFIAPDLSLVIGWTLGIITAVALVATFVSVKNITTTATTLIPILALALFLGSAQLIQNSRGDLGLYYLSPYHWAYSSNPISQKIHTAVNSQEWLLANTNSTDQIMLWVDGPWVQGDRELYVAAGMQLWGENRITLEPTLSQPDIQRLNGFEPNTLALYGKSMDAVINFWESIPQVNKPTTPICYDYPWPADDSSDFPTTAGHTCLTTLTWSGVGTS
jgi:hypothetical protein